MKDETAQKSAATRSRVGRPRALESRTAVSTWLPESEHDQLIRVANQQDLSVSATIRRAVVVFLLKNK